jgi:hypothetical protein
MTVIANHPVRIVSHSNAPYTGSATLFAERSSAIKVFSNQKESFYDDAGIQNEIKSLNSEYRIAQRLGLSRNFYNQTLALLDGETKSLNSTPISAANSREMKAFRFETPFVYDVNYAAYKTIKSLYRHYRKSHETMDFSFRNYNTINFFTASDVPENSCLIYLARANQFPDTKNPYLPEGPFTFDFWINPRYTTLNQGEEFSAGTLLFLSSSYAVSLVTGSSRDNMGLPDGYRLVLQLSSSVDVNLNNVDLTIPNGARPHPQDLIFVSSDNSLKKNHWHHVAIRWGVKEYNNYTGSLYIDNTLNTEFVVNSGSISSSIDPNCLIIGARYEGSNTSVNSIDRFFNTANAAKNGVKSIPGYSTNPTNFNFTNKLNAEFHDLKIFNNFRSTRQIFSSSIEGIAALDDPNLKFYLPPFFTKESPRRQVLVEPFNVKVNTTTSYPFEVTQSMGLRTTSINIENYLRDFSTKQYPLPFALTGSVQSTLIPETEISNIFYRLKELKARNLLVLPNDNGNFRPAFSILASGSNSYLQESSPESRFKNDFNVRDLSKITLRDVIEPSSQITYNRQTESRDNLFEADIAYTALDVLITGDESKLNQNQTAYALATRNAQLPLNDSGNPYADRINIFTLDNPGRAAVADNVNIPGSLFDVFSRGLIPTRVKALNTQPNAPSDPYLPIPFLLNEFDSQEMSFFNVPNIYYGDKIEQRSVYLCDTSVTGSGGRVNICLRDENGALYRADCITPHAKWNDVGNVFYNEGLLAVKSPLLPYFGKDTFVLELSGTRDINVFEINIPCPAGQMDSSSNPTYQKLAPSDNPNETDVRFTYITAVNLHDKNLNIVGKAVFSQPIKKRQNDGFLTRIKIDY